LPRCSAVFPFETNCKNYKTRNSRTRDNWKADDKKAAGEKDAPEDGKRACGDRTDANKEAFQQDHHESLLPNRLPKWGARGSDHDASNVSQWVNFGTKTEGNKIEVCAVPSCCPIRECKTIHCFVGVGECVVPFCCSILASSFPSPSATAFAN
jgi:hypothetical protein